MTKQRDMISPVPTKSDLVERARELAKLFAQEADEAENIRRPTDRAVEALCSSELLKILVPRVYGGFECDFDTFFEVGLALSEGDASLAWVSNFYIEHVWIFSLFPKELQDEVFADRSYALAPSMLSPNGKVTRVDGGYRLNGRWSWSTGIMHAEWILPSAIVVQEDGKKIPMMFALPRSEVEVEDVWFIDGMRGTGSNDVIIEDVFVPDGRLVPFQDMVEGKAPGVKQHPGPLYKTPMLPMLALAAAMPALGQARAALRMYKEKLEERLENGGTRRVGSASYMRLAHAEVRVEQTYSMLSNLVKEVMEIREKSTRTDRTRWAVQLAYAVDQSKRVIGDLCEAAGASSHFEKNRMGRAVRDINTVGSHIVFDLDARLELHGTQLLGQEIPGILV
ncbi:hypothetical protein [Parasphingorhabdus sp.]|uniref:hypothetical protein n=1 Tax=Parasphingorhabdus sp. TaxID=2709688 RepID=UPI003A91F6C1